jgi:hypothetical protein
VPEIRVGALGDEAGAEPAVGASIFGDSVARYTGTDTGGRLTRIGFEPGRGSS